MTNSKRNPLVDEFIGKSKAWQEEFVQLRRILLDFPLTEELKWGKPCYAHDGSNVVLIHGFKEYCALLFMKGALLKDPNGILIQQTENVQAGRQIRFTGAQEIIGMETILKAYVQEAIDAEKSGLEVSFKKTADFTVPEELQKKFDGIPGLKSAFEALTPGRQRAYLFHFSQPRQSKTREARVEKYIPKILGGKGLDD